MKNYFLIFQGFFLFVLLSCGGKQSDEYIQTVRPVKYGKIFPSKGKHTLTYTGVAQSSLETNLSFKVSGTVRIVNVKLGDRINKGQMIASLDPIDYTIQADQASASEKGTEANLKSSETQLLIAQSNYNRIEKLFELNSIPLSEFEQAKSNYEVAQSQHEAAKSQLISSVKQSQSAQNQVNYTRLSAPFSGIVTAINIEVNELVASGSPVAILSAESDPEVNIGIPENMISRVKNDQTVLVSFSALPGQKFDGIVREVSYAAGSSPTYPAIIRIINPSSEIRPGMAATATLILDSDGTPFARSLVSPVQAIGHDGSNNFVYVLEQSDSGNYIAHKRNIKIGELLPDGYEIIDGLDEDELVATAGLRSLLDGMKVKLVGE